MCIHVHFLILYSVCEKTFIATGSIVWHIFWLVSLAKRVREAAHSLTLNLLIKSCILTRKTWLKQYSFGGVTLIRVSQMTLTRENHNSLENPGRNFTWARIKLIRQGGVCHALCCLPGAVLPLEGKELTTGNIKLVEKETFNGIKTTHRTSMEAVSCSFK